MVVRVDLTEEPQGPCLLPLVRVRPADLQATQRQCQRLVEAAEVQIRLAQPHIGTTPDLRYFRRDALLQERQGVGYPPGQHIRVSQGRGDDGQQQRNVPDLADVQAAFEP